MKIKISWLIIFLLLAVDAWLFGPEIFKLIVHPEQHRVINEVDPNSEAFVRAMLPHINMMCDQSRELSAQNRWLRHSLNKCLEKLEMERNLEPISIQPAMPLPLQNDANITATSSSEANKPLFVPYKIPISTMRNDKTANIGKLRSLMSLHIAAIQLSMHSENDWIKNFEERLQRLEKIDSKQ